MEENRELRNRLKTVIAETCNKIGCKNCDLKWDGGCQAEKLQNDIMDLEITKAPRAKE